MHADGILSLTAVDGEMADSVRLWTPPVIGRTVYGGQIAALATLSCGRTVPDGYLPHHVHVTYVAPAYGDAEGASSLRFTATRDRDGRSFAARSCRVTQSGAVVATAAVSFVATGGARHVARPFLEHSASCSAVLRPPSEPYSLPDAVARLQAYLNDPRLPATYVPLLESLMEASATHPIDIRFVNPLPNALDRRVASQPTQLAWIRFSGVQDGTTVINDAAPAALLPLAELVFLSDWWLLLTSLLPLGQYMFPGDVSFMTTLSHALWIHDPSALASAPPGNWFLLQTESPRLGGGRAFVTGRMWDPQSGALVASLAQEGVLHFRRGAEGVGAPARGLRLDAVGAQLVSERSWSDRSSLEVGDDSERSSSDRSSLEVGDAPPNGERNVEEAFSRPSVPQQQRARL